MFKSLLFLAAVLALSSSLSAQIVSEIRTGDVSGQPGEVVEAPIIASFSHPVYAFLVGLNWDR